jgi:hypothetical protein
MKKLPILICIDVEPEKRSIDPKVPVDWAGFEKTFEFFEEFRPLLEETTGGPVHFSWFVRMDPQIEQVYGRAEWPITRYRELFNHLLAMGDEIGLHVHPWRWEETAGNWVADMGDQKWVDHCVRMGFAAFEHSLQRPCLSFRFGDYWMNQATLDLVERLGARFDLTLEPGRTRLLTPEPYTGCLSDYSLVPRHPYHPSKGNFIKSSDSNMRDFWAVPLTTFAPDQVFSLFSPNGKQRRHTSLLEKLRRRSGLLDNGYEGFLDRADYESIAGWAYDPRQGDRPLAVEIYDGRVLIAKVIADGLREDLRLAEKGNGRHSFALPTPSCLRDGKRHQIGARITNTSFELRGSPITIKPNQDSLTELGVMLLDFGADSWLASQITTVAMRSHGRRYLATALRTHEILIPSRRANLHENFVSIVRQPNVQDFVFQTPAELVARME